jgi:hypothetical protein
MKLKSLLLNASILVFSTIVGLLVCEVASRLILHPADYLSVEMVPDPILGAVPSTGSLAGGFDRWGFRNHKVPKSADIVAIGDSHTYGNGVTTEDSWPYALSRVSGRDVYNMGLGGYGPNQYFELLKSRALGLKPRVIICGLYMGDDFANAFQITYGLDHWAYLREHPASEVNPNIWETPQNSSVTKSVRVWLSRRSVVYQLLFHASLLGRLQGNVQISNASQLAELSTSLLVPERHISEAFVSKSVLRELDQDSDSVREGMRITFKLLEEMNEISRKSHIEFIVAVIPTKESVFAEYFQHNSNVSLADTADRVIKNEDVARQKTLKFLDQFGIAHVDILPAMRQAVDQEELYTRSASDMHPNKNGYRVIAEAVAQYLKTSGEIGQAEATRGK